MTEVILLAETRRNIEVKRKLNQVNRQEEEEENELKTERESMNKWEQKHYEHFHVCFMYYYISEKC